MEIGVMTYVNCKHATIKEQIIAMSKAGIKRSFINTLCPNLEDVMALFDEYGIICDFFHCEYKGIYNGKNISFADLAFDGEEGDAMLKILLKDVLQCKKYNVPVLVVHTLAVPPEQANTPILDERYLKLYEFAKENGVTLAFENMYYLENLKHVFELIPEGKLCWDCGHQHSRGDRKRVMPHFGNRTVALHIHDNNLERDEHIIPFEGKIDFNLIAQELADNNFEGTLMLEILYRGELPIDDYYVKAANAARKIADMVEYKINKKSSN